MTIEQLDSLLVRAQNGEDVYDLVYNETRKVVYSFLMTILKNYADTEDVMQDTYVKILKGINGYKGSSNALAWVLEIAKHCAYDHIKKRKNEISTDFADEEYRFGECTIGETPVMLEAVLKSLTEDEQRIVLLHVVGGYKHREIADMEKIPLGTALWKYNQAIKKLKEYVKKSDLL